nr:MAG TPA: hypothetical protein [Caudoviricetes sp.]
MSNSINLGKVAGSAWYTGAATTSSAIHTAVPTARIGDLYLSSGDNTYWQKQSETAWEKKGSLFPKTVVMTEVAFSTALLGNTLENDTLYLVEGETTGQINFIASAGNITYDNSTSGLNANNVQAAIDEVKSKLFSGSYNDLTDKPSELTKEALLTLLLLTNEQLTKLIAFANKITVDSTGVTVGGVLKATTFDTTN